MRCWAGLPDRGGAKVDEVDSWTPSGLSGRCIACLTAAARAAAAAYACDTCVQ